MADISQRNSSRRTFVSKLAASSGLLLTGCDSVRQLQSKFTSHASAQPSADASERSSGPADVTLRIGSAVANIAADHAISTTAYNGSVPGPLIRLSEGNTVTVEVVNDTDSPEFVHWHGFIVPPEVDGVEEENSLSVLPHSLIRYKLTPYPSGSRLVYSRALPMLDLSRGPYSGQFAFVYVEPRMNPGRFDQEVFLATHHWEPFFTTKHEPRVEPKLASPAGYQADAKPSGWEVDYQKATVNGKCLGHGEPIRVKQGDRVLLHLANASATAIVHLSLPGHRFQVTALDGNPVPKPQLVDVVQLAPAERVDAVVEMSNPGVWVLGSNKESDRVNGLGIVIEYANKAGTPIWTPPPQSAWDYSAFADARPPEMPDETIQLEFGKVNGGPDGFDFWTVNGKSFENKDQPHVLHRDARYRIILDNRTGEDQPVHLNRANFALFNVDGKPAGGIVKDVVLVKAFGKVVVDVAPTVAGLSLVHSQHQLRMDFGFKLLFNVV